MPELRVMFGRICRYVRNAYGVSEKWCLRYGPFNLLLKYKNVGGDLAHPLGCDAYFRQLHKSYCLRY